MPQCMRADPFRNPGEQGVAAYEPLHTAGRQAVVVAAQINLFTAAVTNEEWFTVILAFFQVAR